MDRLPELVVGRVLSYLPEQQVVAMYRAGAFHMLPATSPLWAALVARMFQAAPTMQTVFMGVASLKERHFRLSCEMEELQEENETLQDTNAELEERVRDLEDQVESLECDIAQIADQRDELYAAL